MSEVQVRVKSAIGYLASKMVVLKGKGGGVHLVHLPQAFTGCLYFLCLKALRGCCNNPPSQNCWEGESRWSADRSAANIPTMGVQECPMWKAIGFAGSIDLWRGIQCESESWLFLNPEGQGRRRPRGEAQFLVELRKALRPVTFLGLERNCIGNQWWVPHRIHSWSDSVGRWRRFTHNGI